LLENSLKYTAEYPVFGVGIGNFSVYNGHQIHRPDAWLGTHNTFTQLSSEAGIPALALFVWLFWTTLSRMRKIDVELPRNEKSIELRSLANAARASILTAIFAGFFAHIAYTYLYYYLFGVAAGLWAISRRRIRPATTRSSWHRSGIPAISAK
jgi:O-antigen ligase